MEGHAIQSDYRNRDGNPTLVWEEELNRTQRIFMRLNCKLVHNPAADNDDNVEVGAWHFVPYKAFAAWVHILHSGA